MSLRSTYNHEELEAARILDFARIGGDVPETVIIWALFTLGDLDAWVAYE